MRRMIKHMDEALKCWTGIVTNKYTEAHMFPECPLCNIYGGDKEGEECMQCPISIVTGEVNCNNTSFYDTDKYMGSANPSNTIMLTELYQIRRCLITGDDYVPTE